MLIAVDHGNKQIKTVHTPPFTSGLIQSDTPGFGTDALAYPRMAQAGTGAAKALCGTAKAAGPRA